MSNSFQYYNLIPETKSKMGIA